MTQAPTFLDQKVVAFPATMSTGNSTRNPKKTSPRSDQPTAVNVSSGRSYNRLFCRHRCSERALPTTPGRPAIARARDVVQVHLIDRRERRGVEVSARRGDTDPIVLSGRQVDGFLEFHRQNTAAPTEKFR